MSKRQSASRGGGCKAKRRRQHHLYLIFDDWLWGYSIRKVDLSSESGSEDVDLHTAGATGGGATASTGTTGRRLPRAVFRLEAPREVPFHFAAAFGTKIIAMHPTDEWNNIHPLVPRRLAPVFDVRKQALGFSPRPNACGTNPIYISVGDRLVSLSDDSVELLCSLTLQGPDGQCGGQSWQQLPGKLPFHPLEVTSYAVHPDEQTIFVSTKRSATATTFTFHMPEDTEDGGFVWKRHGNWMLPFTGGVHFDRELNAWVGLSGDPDTAGYICACDVASPISEVSNWQWEVSEGECPTWKLSKENLFSENPKEQHAGATLVYMGGRSEFCLVECICIESELDSKRNYYLDENTEVPCRYLFRLSTFSLKFDKNGDLTTGNSRRLRYYKVPQAATEYLLQYPVAFWL